jgi:peptidyl-prolyl cis-trans isomerase SurA
MFRDVTRLSFAALAAAALVAGAAGPVAAQWSNEAAKASAQKSANAQKGKETASTTRRGEQAIVMLVNDEPITAYEIEQRAKFMAMTENVGEKVKANFQRLVQDPNTNAQLQAILQKTIQENQGKSREQILAVFEERKKAYALGLQRQALDSARASVLPGKRKEAQEELIEERLKMQEARKMGIEIPDEEVSRIVRGIAEKNNMTEKQFGEHIKGMGSDIAIMRTRFRAGFAWREVVRRRFAPQISISQRDLDRFISTGGLDGEESVELQLQKVVLPLPAKIDQAAITKRYAEADVIRGKFKGCPSLSGLVTGAPGARIEVMNSVKPAAIPEPTRSLLLAAKDGDLLPPATSSAGVELYAVCGRKTITANADKRQKAENELQSREFENLAKKHLRDLRQDAHIEMR